MGKTGKKALFSGSSDWVDVETMEREFQSLLDEGYSIAICSIFEGAEEMARELAADMGFKVKSYYPDFELHERAAGSVRNKGMLAHSQPDLVVLFVTQMSQMTEHLMKLSKARSIPVKVVKSHLYR